MKNMISEIDIKKSSNAKRCQMILEIIKGQAIYKGVKTNG